MGKPGGLNRLARRPYWGWFGFAYGCVLMVFGFACTEVGHGTYAPLAMYGAPASILPGAGFFAAPGWWALIGWLLSRRKASALGVLLPLHTLSSLIFLVFGSPYMWGPEHWEHFRRVNGHTLVWLFIGLVLYLIGLVVAWKLALGMRKSIPPLRGENQTR